MPRRRGLPHAPDSLTEEPGCFRKASAHLSARPGPRPDGRSALLCQRYAGWKLGQKRRVVAKVEWHPCEPGSALWRRPSPKVSRIRRAECFAFQSSVTARAFGRKNPGKDPIVVQVLRRRPCRLQLRPRLNHGQDFLRTLALPKPRWSRSRRRCGRTGQDRRQGGAMAGTSRSNWIRGGGAKGSVPENPAPD